MIFNSFHFMVFFPLVCAAFFSIPHRYRWALLLGASYYFYMAWEPAYAILLLISTFANYLAGIMIHGSKSRRARIGWLLFGLIPSFGIMGFFKYYNFLRESLHAVLSYTPLSVSLPYSRFLLPVGISFFTFQTLSYTIEVYKKTQTPERHLGVFALYVSFFPQLVAGPIERSFNLLPQLTNQVNFDYYRIADGLKLIAWGMFKKVVIADRLSLVVNAVYNDPHKFNGVFLSIATVFFAFQIYCDFSGYSDIAIGTAQVLGIKLMDNFKRPYLSRSIPEFWRRWHISLSTWFRDYMYIPLGGNRVSEARHYFNLMFVFLVCGLWHGANWTFVVWGGVHGLLIVVSNFLRSRDLKPGRLLGFDRFGILRDVIPIGFTFFLTTLAWVFFRANTLSDASHVIANLPSGWGAAFNFRVMADMLFLTGIGKFEFILCGALILFLVGVQILQSRVRMRDFIARRPKWVRWSIYYAGILCLLLLGKYNQSQFIYFQF